jgi:hypothetical protein
MRKVEKDLVNLEILVEGQFVLSVYAYLLAFAYARFGYLILGSRSSLLKELNSILVPLVEKWEFPSLRKPEHVLPPS